jgi:hypothetical protein
MKRVAGRTGLQDSRLLVAQRQNHWSTAPFQQP